MTSPPTARGRRAPRVPEGGDVALEPGVGPGEGDVAGRLRVAVTRLHRRLRAESLAGLTPSQSSALASVSRLGRPTLGELAQAEGVQPPSMTPVVVALESSGLLSRIQEPADRRVSRVELTDAGRTTVAHVRSLRDAFLARRLSALGVADEDVRPLVELLENLVAE